MKAVTLIAGLLVGQFALAAPIFCSGNGWNLEVSNDLSTAKLTHNNKTVLFGDLKCEVVDAKDPQASSVLSCRPAHQVMDAGFFVDITLAAPGENMSGKLSSESVIGPRHLADLSCVSAEN